MPAIADFGDKLRELEGIVGFAFPSFRFDNNYLAKRFDIREEQMTRRKTGKADTAKGFVLLPRRWAAERTLAWLSRNRRLAKGFEATLESAKAWIYISSVKLLSRRLART